MSIVFLKWLLSWDFKSSHFLVELSMISSETNCESLSRSLWMCALCTAINELFDHRFVLTFCKQFSRSHCKGTTILRTCGNWYSSLLQLSHYTVFNSRMFFGWNFLKHFFRTLSAQIIFSISDVLKDNIGIVNVSQNAVHGIVNFLASLIVKIIKPIFVNKTLLCAKFS